MASTLQPVTIKRYGASRLYHPATGCYLSLQDLAAMVEENQDLVLRDAKSNQDLVLRDAKSGEDITAFVLKQVISECARHG